MIKSNGEGNGARKGRKEGRKEGGKEAETLDSRVEIEAGSKGDQCHSNAKDTPISFTTLGTAARQAECGAALASLGV